MFDCLRYRCRLLESRCVAFQQEQQVRCANCLQGVAIASRHGVKVEVRVVVMCKGPNCKRPANRNGLCWGHRKQLMRAGKLTPLRGYQRAAAYWRAL
jgi:hypothetical protein